MNWKSGLLSAAGVAGLMAGSAIADPQTTPVDGINLRRTVVVDVVEKTKDAVVYIAAEKLVKQRVPTLPQDPIFQQFDPGQIRTYRGNSLGSGFIVHPDGLIITNNHVVRDAVQITVELLDGRKLPAKLVSSDSQADLAVLQVISDKPLPTVELGDSSDLMIGEPVIAVGNPLGLSHTVSTGIVSANHRDLQGDGGAVLADLIQTDAAINPGNSGGPLLNAYGQVIGINTAIRKDAQNLGFAIQINKLRDMIPDLLNPKQVSKVEMPVTLKEKRTLTAPASVASTIELKDGDKQIELIADVKPKNIIDAYTILLKQKADKPFDITFADGSKQSISPTAVPAFDALAVSQKRLGLVVEPVTGDLATKYSLEAQQGMFVSKVMRDSPAFKSGVRPGDVIVQIGRFPVSSQEDYSSLMQMLPEHGRVAFVIVRGDARGQGFMTL